MNDDENLMAEIVALAEHALEIAPALIVPSREAARLADGFPHRTTEDIRQQILQHFRQHRIGYEVE
jgi:hypothetical protein